MQVKHLTERIDTGLRALEIRMEASLKEMDVRMKVQGERIGAIEKEPGTKWKELVKQVITLVVAAVVGGAITWITK